MGQQSVIGVFDSGIGGLSVLHHIRRQLPHEALLYVADSRYAPYGMRAEEEIVDRCERICHYLISRDAKAIVVACNTATAAAIDHLRQTFDLPIIGMEPGIKPALASSKSGRIAVLATDNTLASEKFNALIQRYGKQQQVLIQPFTDLVPLIETGEFDHPRIHAKLKHIIPGLRDQQIDTIVLGCSHYPLIIDQIRQHAGPQVNVIDTGDAIARETARRLSEENLLNQKREKARSELYSTTLNPKDLETLHRLWPDAELISQTDLLTEYA